MARLRGLSDEDRAVWAALARQVKPLPGRMEIIDAPAASTAGPIVAASPVPSPRPIAAAPRRSAAPISVGDAPAGLDKATWQRFRGGSLSPERRLDLHTHTAQAAHYALDHFLRRAQADGVRCVEVITGRGRDGAGILRREVPLWLNLPSLRPLLLAVAHPHAANDGALRILLRRTRQ